MSISDSLKNKINLSEKILHATADEKFDEIMSIKEEDSKGILPIRSKDNDTYRYGAR